MSEAVIKTVQHFIETIPFTTSGKNFEDGFDHSFATYVSGAVIFVGSLFFIATKIGCNTTFPSDKSILPWNYTSLRLVGWHVFLFGASCACAALARYLVDHGAQAPAPTPAPTAAPAAAGPATGSTTTSTTSTSTTTTTTSAGAALRLLAVAAVAGTDFKILWVAHVSLHILSVGALFMAALAFPDITYPFPSNYRPVIFGTLALMGVAVHGMLSSDVSSWRWLDLAVPAYHVLAALVGWVSGAMFTAPNFASGCFFTIAAWALFFVVLFVFPSCSDPEQLGDCPFPKNFNHEACKHVVFLVALFFFSRTKRPHENLERSRTGFTPLRTTTLSSTNL